MRRILRRPPPASVSALAESSAASRPEAAYRGRPASPPMAVTLPPSAPRRRERISPTSVPGPSVVSSLLRLVRTVVRVCVCVCVFAESCVSRAATTPAERAETGAAPAKYRRREAWYGERAARAAAADVGESATAEDAVGAEAPKTRPRAADESARRGPTILASRAVVVAAGGREAGQCLRGGPVSETGHGR